jgi:hypothetical protein
MESKRLDNAALAAGISPNYINAHGKPQSISAETKRRLLDAMHQRTATKVAVTPVPNVMVYTSVLKRVLISLIICMWRGSKPFTSFTSQRSSASGIRVWLV